MDHEGHRQHETSPLDAHASHNAHADHAEAEGHDKHAGHSIAMFRDRFWLSALLTLPILVWS